jgi:DNA helicase-2/ATP-dependent DNA helicase PcrA
VVGDPDQAIYAFAGADAAQLTDFTRRFGGGHVLRLDCNYRSSPEIVAAAEALLADGGRPRPARRAVAPRGTPPTITAYDDDDAEAAGVADALRTAHGPHVSWSALAVLYRTNAQSAAFEEALTRAGIPFRVRGDARFLERPEVVSALQRLRESAAAVPGRTFAEHVIDLEADAASAPEQQREHVDALVRLAHEYLAVEAGPGAVDGFAAYLTAALRGEAPEPGGDAVELLTFHRAKGLEFHTVFVTGLERGYVPIAHAETPADRAEERRLLYVALTRAEQCVHLSYAKERTMGMRTVRRARSPWLAPIEAAGSPAGAPASTANGTNGLARARAQLAHAATDATEPEPDVALFGALVEWRRNLARASGVPAYVIFHDTTLKTVAAVKPATRDALLAVPGIGPVKVERHAEAVLDLVRRHAS